MVFIRLQLVGWLFFFFLCTGEIPIFHAVFLIDYFITTIVFSLPLSPFSPIWKASTFSVVASVIVHLFIYFFLILLESVKL